MSSLGYCGLESRGMSDCIFRHESAIAPATDAEPIRIGDFLLNEVINAVHHILVSHPAPVRYCFVQSPAFTIHTSGVWQEDHITICSQELTPGPPLCVKADPPGRITGMSINNCWVRLAGLITGRRNKYASTGQAVL